MTLLQTLQRILVLSLVFTTTMLPMAQANQHDARKNLHAFFASDHSILALTDYKKLVAAAHVAGDHNLDQLTRHVQPIIDQTAIPEESAVLVKSDTACEVADITKIDDDPRSTTVLGNSVVRTINIADGAVTTNKLADASVTRSKLALGSIGSDQLDPNISLKLSGSSQNKPNKLVLRDTNGSFSANIITANSLVGSISGTADAAIYVAGVHRSHIKNSVTATEAATSTNTASTIVTRDADGNFSANIITANSLVGSISGTADAAVYVGDIHRSHIKNAVTATEAATSSNTASTIVKRDADGNFSAGTVTASGITAQGGLIDLNVDSNYATNINTGTSSGTVNIGSGTGAVNIGNSTGNTAITGTLTTSDKLTVSSGGATITGNSSVTGNLTVSGTLSSSSSGTANAAVYIGGINRQRIIASVAATESAGSVDSGSTIVKRDGSGNIWVHTANVDGLENTGNANIAGALSVTKTTTCLAGITVSGRTTSINASSNYPTNINTGTSTGGTNIGNSANTTTILGTTYINTSGSGFTMLGGGTNTIAINGTANINTGSEATSTIGNSNSTTEIQSGTTNINASGAGTVNIGRGTGAVNIGNNYSNTTITGNASVSGTFGATGATTLASTLGVTGATTLSSGLNVSGGTVQINYASNYNTSINGGGSSGTTNIGSSTSTTNINSSLYLNNPSSLISIPGTFYPVYINATTGKLMYTTAGQIINPVD